MDFNFEKIFESDMAGKGNMGQPDTPGVSADEMKRIMDELVREVVVPKFNKLVDAISGAFETVTNSVSDLSTKYDAVNKTATEAKTAADTAAQKAAALESQYTALEARVKALEGK